MHLAPEHILSSHPKSQEQSKRRFRPGTYAELISKALEEGSKTLPEIYVWFYENTKKPNNKTHWQGALRHVLNTNPVRTIASATAQQVQLQLYINLLRNLNA